MQFINEIVEKMNPLSKPQKNFLKLLLTTILLMKGKVNYLNLGRYSQTSERTFRRNFQKQVNFAQFNQLTIKQVVAATTTQIWFCCSQYEEKIRRC